MSGSMLRAARSAAARGYHVKHDSHNSTSQISLIPRTSSWSTAEIPVPDVWNH